MTLARALLAFASLFAAGCAIAQPAGTGKRYPLAGHGTLVLAAPAGWTDSVRQNDKGVPPTIFYSTVPERQQVMITPLVRARPDLPPFTPGSVRQNVEQGIRGVKEQAAEKNIRVTGFQGKSGPGWYFEATDKAPKPGEYKFLRQGMVMLSGDLVLWFTILADGPKDPAVRDAMHLLESATLGN